MPVVHGEEFQRLPLFLCWDIIWNINISDVPRTKFSTERVKLKNINDFVPVRWYSWWHAIALWAKGSFHLHGKFLKVCLLLFRPNANFVIYVSFIVIRYIHKRHIAVCNVTYACSSSVQLRCKCEYIFINLASCQIMLYLMTTPRQNIAFNPSSKCIARMQILDAVRMTSNCLPRKAKMIVVCF